MTAPVEQPGRCAALPETTAVRIKVEQDIAFLTSQIARLEQQASSNITVLETYKMVLNSRYAVLKWLLHDNAGQTEQSVIEQYSA